MRNRIVRAIFFYFVFSILCLKMSHFWANSILCLKMSHFRANLGCTVQILWNHTQKYFFARHCHRGEKIDQWCWYWYCTLHSALCRVHCAVCRAHCSTQAMVANAVANMTALHIVQSFICYFARAAKIMKQQNYVSMFVAWMSDNFFTWHAVQKYYRHIVHFSVH